MSPQFLPFIILMPISEQKYSDAEIIKDNFEQKRFRTTTLEPFEKKSGFVYFNWNDLKIFNKIDLCFKNIEAVTSNYFDSCVKVSLQDGTYE
jgi:hypothetical protein